MKVGRLTIAQSPSNSKPITNLLAQRCVRQGTVEVTGDCLVGNLFANRRIRYGLRRTSPQAAVRYCPSNLSIEGVLLATLGEGVVDALVVVVEFISCRVSLLVGVANVNEACVTVIHVR